MAILAPPTTDTLEAHIARLRDDVFALVDQARSAVPYECTALHVSLQAASNELGKAERALREA
ncbi:MAG: hypothetical protein QOE65_2609 [Solirubrobacteraceae bacterium]|jgi:hypothetical protein|nr:hypothetical protein [Solirubrobacteraceae bacterium]